MRIISLLVIGLLAAAFLPATLQYASAQQAESMSSFRFKYTPSFVCGVDPPGATFRILPGTYATSINVVNPRNKKDISIRMRVALTFPHGPDDPFDPGMVSEPVTVELDPNQAFNVDCEEILLDFIFPQPPAAPYVKGTVIIESSRFINVSAVHTAGDSEGNVKSIAVESIDGGSISF